MIKSGIVQVRENSNYHEENKAITSIVLYKHMFCWGCSIRLHNCLKTPKHVVQPKIIQRTATDLSVDK